MSQNTTMIGGGISEEGLINNLSRLGVVDYKAINELLHNSIDANRQGIVPRIVIKQRINGEISIIDNGKGMNVTDILRMLVLQHPNSINDKPTTGIAGAGFQLATRHLSKGSDVTVSTKMENGEFIVWLVPWEEILRDKVYTNKCTRINATREMEDTFNVDRAIPCDGSEISGTTITFKPNTELWGSILAIMCPGVRDENRHLKDFVKYPQFSVGYSNLHMSLFDEQDGKSYTLYEKYNPTDLSPELCYSKARVSIICYKIVVNGSIVYLADYLNNTYECKKTGRGYEATPSEIPKNKYEDNSNYKYIPNEQFEFRTCLQKDSKWFDMESSTHLPGGGKHLFPMQKQCGFDNSDSTISQLGKVSIIRNNVKTGDTVASSPAARAGLKSRILASLTSSIHYTIKACEPDSAILDDTFEVNAVKSDSDPILPVNLKRLLSFVQEKVRDDIYSKLENAVSKNTYIPEEEESDTDVDSNVGHCETDDNEHQNLEEEDEETTYMYEEDSTANNTHNNTSENSNSGEEDDESSVSNNSVSSDTSAQSAARQEIVATIPDPIQRQLGTAIQNRYTKKVVNHILNTTLPEYINKLTNEEKPRFESEYCKALMNMVYEVNHHGQGVDDVFYRMAIQCGSNFCKNEYMNMITNKLDSDTVAGGSKLRDFIESHVINVDFEE
jgi:hypothetical protein